MKIQSSNLSRIPTNRPAISIRETDALKRDVGAAQIRNQSVIGRQARRTEEDSAKLETSDSLVEKRASEDKAKLQDARKNTERKQARFLKSFGDNVSSGEALKLTQSSAGSLRDLAEGGMEGDPAAVLAAHTYNHAKSTSNRPLMKDAAAYLRANQSESGLQREAGVAPPQFSQEFLAGLMADRQKTWLSVGDTLAAIAAERMKTAAQIQQMAAQTSQEIADIYMAIFAKQAKSALDKHKKSVYLFTEVWPK